MKSLHRLGCNNEDMFITMRVNDLSCTAMVQQLGDSCDLSGAFVKSVADPVLLTP
jgi:hypothetical protein